jgi:hypothetical protein
VRRQPSPRLAAVAAIAALAACSDADTHACPGEDVATFTFSGPRVTREALDPALDPVPAAPDCATDIAYPDALVAFTATISTDPTSGTAALCRSGRAQQLYGTLSAGRLDVSTATDGAVLGDPCPAGCVAVMTLTIRGTVSGAGAAARFDGAVVEQLAVREGADCGACALPCAARYDADGLPPGPP